MPKPGIYLGLFAIAASVALSVPLLAESASKDTPGVLTTAQQIRDLSGPEAAQQRPVKLRAVVNYVDPSIGELFVEDSTNGVFVFLNQSKLSEPLRAGQLVEIVGVTTPGDFAPAITNDVITVVGTVPLLEPKVLAFDEYSQGQHECQRVEVEGVVQSGQIKQGHLQLNVHTIGGKIVATTNEFPKDWADRLVRSRVRLRGVIAAIFNQHRQAVGVRMFIPGGEMTVLQAGPADPFALPLSPIASVGQLRSQQQLPKAIRVRATVTALTAGTGMYISDGALALEAQDANLCGAMPGDVTDIVGFPGLLEGQPALENSICRKTGERGAILPEAVAAEKVLPMPRVEDASGYGYSVDSHYDMQLLRMEGTLLQTSDSQEGEIWVMNSGKTSFDAIVPLAMVEESKGLQAGTRLQLTGVCIVSFDQFGRGQSFRLLLRSNDDVVVLGRPPWWSLRHAAWIVAAGLISFLAALLWISVLRRQVGQKTQELQRTNESLQKLSNQDGLTGIANRRQFDVKLTAEANRVRRPVTHLSLLMVDIDCFKALNDEYGHLHGDECLVRVAKTMNLAIHRAEDLVARYGGEEFAVILPGTGHTGAMEVAERIRAAVQELAIPHNGSPYGHVLTVSVGVATAESADEKTYSKLVELADRALYRSKVLGRNRVTSSEEVEEMSAGEMQPLDGHGRMGI